MKRTVLAVTHLGTAIDVKVYCFTSRNIGGVRIREENDFRCFPFLQNGS